MSNMGYIPKNPVNPDYYKSFPEAYRQTRVALFRLYQTGVLEMRQMDDPNSHGEEFHFKVVKPHLLENMARDYKQSRNRS